MQTFVILPVAAGVINAVNHPRFFSIYGALNREQVQLHAGEANTIFIPVVNIPNPCVKSVSYETIVPASADIPGVPGDVTRTFSK